MRRFRGSVAVFVVAALLLGAGGGAAWAAFGDVTGWRFEASANYLQGLGVLAGYPDGTFRPWDEISRAEATKIMIMILGRGAEAAALRGTGPFADSRSHWAGGFIALARNLGIVSGFPDGTFRPESPVTYAQMAKMLVEAAGLSPAPGQSWPSNYMNVAQAQGLFQGLPSYPPDSPAIRGDCAMMTAFTVQRVANPATGLTLEQSVFGVASVAFIPAEVAAPVNSGVQLTAVARDPDGNVVPGQTLTYSASDPNAVVSPTGMFLGIRSGSYTVTATTSNGVKGTCLVRVYGAAKKLGAVASVAQVPANGLSKVAVTVTVQDDRGNRVANDSATRIQMSHEASNGAVVLGSTPLAVSGGTATFELTAGTEPGRQDVVRFRDAGGLLTQATVTIGTIEQVETRILVEAGATSLTVNSSVSTSVTATVCDQLGQPMLDGTWDLVFTISGHGTFDDQRTSARTQSTVGQQATLDVWSIQGEPGQMTVTVSRVGLTGASVSMRTYLAGEPARIVAEVKDQTIESCDVGASANTAQLTVSLLDINGNPSTMDADLALQVTLANGDDLASVGLDVTGEPVIEAHESTTETLRIGAAGTDAGRAGTHVIKVTPGDDELDSITFQVTVSAGDPDAIAPSLTTNVKLPITKPETEVVVQLLDGAGNAVPRGDVVIAVGWKDPHTANTGKPTINGVLNPPQDESSPQAVTAKTDASGRARFDFGATGYVGDDYQLKFKCGAMTVPTGEIAISDRICGDLELAFKNLAGQTISQLAANDADRAELTVQVRDANDTPLGGEEVTIAFGEDGANVREVTVETGTVIVPYAGGRVTVMSDPGPGADLGKIVIAFGGGRAASFQVTATARECAPPVVRSKSFRVAPGSAVAGVQVTTASGGSTASLNVAGDVPIELRLHPADYGGNPIAAPGDVKVLVSQSKGLYWVHGTSGSGQFRVTAAGTEIPQGTELVIPRGLSSLKVYYVQPKTESGVKIAVKSDADAYCAYQFHVVAETYDSAAHSYHLSYVLQDGSGRAMGGVQVLTDPDHGTVTPATVTTASDGKVSVTWAGGVHDDWLCLIVKNALAGDGSEVAHYVRWH